MTIGFSDSQSSDFPISPKDHPIGWGILASLLLYSNRSTFLNGEAR